MKLSTVTSLNANLASASDTLATAAVACENELAGLKNMITDLLSLAKLKESELARLHEMRDSLTIMASEDYDAPADASLPRGYFRPKMVEGGAA